MKWIKKTILLLALVIISFLSYVLITGKSFHQIALEGLEWIKSVKGDKVNIEKLKVENGPLADHQLWTSLLQTHVSDDGSVDYPGFRKDYDRLAEYLNHLSDHPPGKNWSEKEQLAYWINAYNAFTVQLILNHYPIESIKDIARGLPMINSSWDITFFKINNVNMDLNTIEHDILRKQFDEPRIHFAINCASVSCPMLRAEAYDPDLLEEQLDGQAKIFIRDTLKNIINVEKTVISPIFQWFKEDFTNKGSLKSYLKHHHPEMNIDNPITYMDYDWSLNE